MEGQALALLMQQVRQTVADALHAVSEVLAHLSEGGVLRQGRDPPQLRVSRPQRLSTSSGL